MKQFDVFDTLDAERFCILQSDILEDLRTVMAAPLLSSGIPSVSKLTPAVYIDGTRYFVDVLQQVSLTVVSLRGVSPSASLKEYHDDIMNVVNMLYWGI